MSANLNDNNLIFEAYMQPKRKKVKPAFDIFDFIFKEQEELIRTTFGKRAAETANYGWGQGEDSCCTKVYTRGGFKYVQSYFDPEDQTGESVRTEIMDE